MKFMTAAFVTTVSLTMLLGAADARELRLSHNQGPDHPVHKSMEMMAERVSELTDGELTIAISPNAQLGNQRESLELVQAGVLDMAKSNASELEAFEPLYGVLNVPYIFEDRDHFYKALTGEPGEAILQASTDKGFIGLTYYDAGARSFYANKPITQPSDLSGMKIRVQPSPTAIRMIELLGASPTPLPFGELYTALQQGVVDGAENNETALVTARHGEVAKFYSKDGHTRIPDVLVISSATWDGLPEEQKSALKQAAMESMEFHKDLWTKEIEAAIEQAKSEMNVEFVDVDNAPFAETTKSIKEEAAAQSEEAAKLIEEIDGMRGN